MTHAGAAAATMENEPSAPPTKSTAEEMSERAKDELAKIAKEMGMPVWALYCIGIGKFFFSCLVSPLLLSRRFSLCLDRMLFSSMFAGWGVVEKQFDVFLFFFFIHSFSSTSDELYSMNFLLKLDYCLFLGWWFSFLINLVFGIEIFFL